jgi:hypothetical protein
VVLGGIDVALILTSNHVDVRGAWAALALVVGWGFIGAGLFAWARRPNNSVEKHVTSIFGKLGLAPAPEDHRRVLAVLAFLRA